MLAYLHRQAQRRCRERKWRCQNNPKIPRAKPIPESTHNPSRAAEAVDMSHKPPPNTAKLHTNPATRAAQLKAVRRNAEGTMR